MRKLASAWRLLRRSGVRAIVNECADQWSDRYYDRLYGVETCGVIEKSALGLVDPETVEYAPVPYRRVFAMLERVPRPPSESVFLDYGCGKGRALVAAATRPFRRVIGVEISDLIAIAERNLARMRCRRAADVQLHRLDAQHFDVPVEVDVVYFYNPFVGGLLERVVAKLRSSWEQRRRKLSIVYFNHDRFDALLERDRWLTKRYEGAFHPGTTCALYETVD